MKILETVSVIMTIPFVLLFVCVGATPGAILMFVEGYKLSGLMIAVAGGLGEAIICAKVIKYGAPPGL